MTTNILKAELNQSVVEHTSAAIDDSHSCGGGHIHLDIDENNEDNNGDSNDYDEGVDEDMSSMTIEGGTMLSLVTNNQLNGIEYNYNANEDQNEQIGNNAADSVKDGCPLDDNGEGYKNVIENPLKYNGGDGIIANLFVGWYFSIYFH